MTEAIVRTFGVLLTIGAVLFAAGAALHPPEVPDPAAQQAIVAQQAGAWGNSHMLIAFGAVLLAAAGILALTGVRAPCGPAGYVGWALFTLGLVLFVPVAGIEATTAIAAATAGDAATFGALSSVVFGLLFTLPAVFLGVAFLAWDATTGAAVPRALAGLGVVVGGAMFVVSAAALWAGNAAAGAAFNPLALLTLLWIAAFGAVVATRGAAQASVAAAPA